MLIKRSQEDIGKPLMDKVYRQKFQPCCLYAVYIDKTRTACIWHPEWPGPSDPAHANLVPRPFDAAHLPHAQPIRHCAP